MDEKTKLMNKSLNDLTVGDAVKINVGLVAIAVAIPVTLAMAASFADKVSAWNTNRKNAKAYTERFGE